jgi:hypothetical protein
MANQDDTRPFPIQGGLPSTGIKPSTIPWWLAEIAYDHYAKMYGRGQSLERMAERGGFGRKELLALLRKEDPYA